MGAAQAKPSELRDIIVVAIIFGITFNESFIIIATDHNFMCIRQRRCSQVFQGEDFDCK